MDNTLVGFSPAISKKAEKAIKGYYQELETSSRTGYGFAQIYAKEVNPQFEDG